MNGNDSLLEDIILDPVMEEISRMIFWDVDAPSIAIEVFSPIINNGESLVRNFFSDGNSHIYGGVAEFLPRGEFDPTYISDETRSLRSIGRIFKPKGYCSKKKNHYMNQIVERCWFPVIFSEEKEVYGIVHLNKTNEAPLKKKRFLPAWRGFMVWPFSGLDISRGWHAAQSTISESFCSEEFHRDFVYARKSLGSLPDGDLEGVYDYFCQNVLSPMELGDFSLWQFDGERTSPVLYSTMGFTDEKDLEFVSDQMIKLRDQGIEREKDSKYHYTDPFSRKLGGCLDNQKILDAMSADPDNAYYHIDVNDLDPLREDNFDSGLRDYCRGLSPNRYRYGNYLFAVEIPNFTYPKFYSANYFARTFMKIFTSSNRSYEPYD
tara:strand:+ start:304 stop:1434 length:1131 start_codon:yes stop_codon:yes gene_type:complete